jgi:hypothetical protein
MGKFELTDKEQETIDIWQKKQRKKENKTTTAIGGRWTYQFTPTGIGTFIKVFDNLLDEEIDITDYDNL